MTGASGYLGRHVLANLTSRGVRCVPTSRRGDAGVACDLTDADAARSLIRHIAPAVVIHCAAVVPATPAEYGSHASEAASVGMLETVAASVSCPIVLASSMTVYGAGATYPVREDAQCAPAPGYARGKRSAEELLLARGQQGDVVMRLPGLFGLPRRSGLLYRAALAFLNGDRFDIDAVSGPWAAMAVGDAAECLVRAATMPSGDRPQAVNAGYHGEFTVDRAVAELAGICGAQWSVALQERPVFSMDLGRFELRYGPLGVTFLQRLAEFVDALRHDVISGASLAR